MTPLFPEPAGREEKPDFSTVPRIILDKISTLAGEPVISGVTAYGGLSAAAGFIMTLASGRKIFVKGNHPEEMAHGTANLRQEIGIYQKALVLKTVSPAFIGAVDDGDEDGWMLGVWEYIAATNPPSLPSLMQTMAAWQAAASPLPPAGDHNYLRLFLNDDKKWRRIKDEAQTRDKFLSIFADPKMAGAWLDRNIDGLVALQARISDMKFAEGLLHGDLRLDNFLFASDKTFVIDWANACHGPLLFDVLFLFSNLEGLGLGDMPDLLRQYAAFSGRSFSSDDIAVMLGILSGFFADQAYRKVPEKLPRLRWMQRCMLASQLKTLANLGFVESIPQIVASSR